MTQPAAIVKPETRWHFDLSEKLMDWLQALVQNPIYEDETPEERAFRFALFQAIKNAKATNPVIKTRPIVPTVSDFNPDDEIPF